MPTTAAAPPPTALKRLTSCGIAVIATVRAKRKPIAEPSSAPAPSTAQPVPSIEPSCTITATVVSTAAVMPVADSRSPRLAVAGEFIMCSPSTSAPATTR